MNNNKYRAFSIIFLMVAAMVFSLTSCASRVTDLSDPVSVIFHTPEEYEYIADAPVPLANFDDEADPLRVLAIEVFDLCNQEREAKGLVKFKWNEELYVAAMERAKELQENFSHTRPDGSHFYSVVEEAGIPAGVIGENIAIGQRNAQKLVQTWMRYANIKAYILGDYEYIGVGVSECPEDSIYDGFAFAQLLYNP